jgi:plastocyanin
MHRFARMVVGTIAVVALSACSSGGTATGGAATQGTAASQGTTGDPCSKSTETGTVQAGVADFAFNPTTVTASVGDTITWTNAGPAGHTVTLDSVPACDTGTIASGATGSLKFTVAGTYPFHCKIHASMKGTITISG